MFLQERKKNAFFLSKSVSVMILKKNFIILLKVRLDNWKKKNVLCMFASLLSLAHSHVVHSLTALINSSRLALALCVCVYLCAYVFARVYVLYILHRGARGLRWSHRATATSHCPPPSQSPVPLWPFAPRLAGSPASGRHTQTQALPPHQPLPEHTHHSLHHPPLGADRYSSSPFI